MYVSLLEELQLIQTLLDGLQRMVPETIATETTPSTESGWAERARVIREQLEWLSNEITESIHRSP